MLKTKYRAVMADRSAVQGVTDVAIYGRISTLELFRPPVRPGGLHTSCIGKAGIIRDPLRIQGCHTDSKWLCDCHLEHALQGETKDLLFLSTERCKFCVLEYNQETGAPTLVPLMCPPAAAAHEPMRPSQHCRWALSLSPCRKITLHQRQSNVCVRGAVLMCSAVTYTPTPMLSPQVGRLQDI